MSKEQNSNQIKFGIACISVFVAIFFLLTILVGRGDAIASPSASCAALQSLGIRTGDWKKDQHIENGWHCFSPLRPFGKYGALGMQNNIAYYVTGSSYNQVSRLDIKVNINNEAEAKKALGLLTAATIRLVEETLDWKVPREIMASFHTRNQSKVTHNGLAISFVHEPGKIDSYIVSITPDS